MAIALMFWFMYDNHKKEQFEFSASAFFNFFLPPVIFNSGFNMRKKKFFQNLGNVAIFGLFVTFVCFFLYSVATWWLINNMDF